MVEEDQLARELGVLPQQLAELRKLVETDTADRVVDEVEVAGVDAVNCEDAYRASGEGPDVRKPSPLPPFLEACADNREIFGLWARAPQTETGCVVVAGDDEESADIKPGISHRRPQHVPGRELAAVADIAGDENKVGLLNCTVAKKAGEVCVHVAGTVLFPAPIVFGCQVEVGEVGD